MFRKSPLSVLGPAILLLLVSGAAAPQGPGPEALQRIQGEQVLSDFSLRDIGGAVHRLSSYRGRVVLVTFWASWCPQCLSEMPEIDAMWKEIGQDRLKVLAVNVGEDFETISKYQRREGLSFPLLLDSEMAVYKEWPLLGLPTTFLINKEGLAIYKAVGYVDWNQDQIKGLINAMLQPVETPSDLNANGS